MKRLFLCCTLISSIYASCSEPLSEFIFRLFFGNHGNSSQVRESVDYESVRLRIVQRMEHDLRPGMQSTAIKSDVYRMIEDTQRNVLLTVERNRPYNQDEANSQAEQLASAQSLAYIQKKAEAKAQQTIRNFGGNLSSTQQAQFVRDVTSSITGECRQALAHGNRISEQLQHLDSIVESKLQSLINNHFDNRPEQLDVQSLQLRAQQRIEFLLKSGKQEAAIRSEIETLMRQITPRIAQQVAANGHASQRDAQQRAEELATQAALAYLVDKAKAVAAYLIDRSGNAQLPTKAAIIQRIVEDIAQQALNMVGNGDHLEVLLKNLSSRIENALQGELARAKQDANAITEIYPSGARGQEYKADIERRKNFRENECPILYEEFSKDTPRVNLVCGHSICISCLKDCWAKNLNTCPKCRKPILQSDFPQFLG